MSLRRFCQQWRAHMVPRFHILTFCRCCLSFLTWGHNGTTMWTWMQRSVWEWFVCFSVMAYCLISGHSPPSTWCYPFCEWLMCLSQRSRSDKTRRSREAEKDWESVWQREKCEDKSKRWCNNSLSAYLLSSIWCRWNAGSSFEMPPRLADQGWKIAAVDKLTGAASYVSPFTPRYEQAAQCKPFGLFVSILILLRFWGKDWRLHLNCLPSV